MKKEKVKNSSAKANEKNKKAQKVRKISDKITRKIKGGRLVEERASIGNCNGPCG